MSATVGRAWVFGDDVDTDTLAPGAYIKFDIDVIARHCLEALDPAFAAGARSGDVVVAGRNCGIGSSREQAAQALQRLGIAAVVAESFAGIFYRNALNVGLMALVCSSATRIPRAAILGVDVDEARVVETTNGVVHACEPIPAHLIAMVRAGGLIAHLAQRLAAERAAVPRPIDPETD